MNPPGSRLLCGIVGTACVVGGAIVTVRPVATVSALVVFVAVYLVVTGVGDLIGAGPVTDHPGRQRGAGLASMAAGVVAYAWPDATVAVVAFIAGISMVIDGAARIGGFADPADRHAGRNLRGVASIALGVLAMVWPRSTVLVIAALFGLRTVLFGLEFLAAALGRPDPEPVPG